MLKINNFEPIDQIRQKKSINIPKKHQARIYKTNNQSRGRPTAEQRIARPTSYRYDSDLSLLLFMALVSFSGRKTWPETSAAQSRRQLRFIFRSRTRTRYIGFSSSPRERGTSPYFAPSTCAGPSNEIVGYFPIRPWSQPHFWPSQPALNMTVDACAWRYRTHISSFCEINSGRGKKTGKNIYIKTKEWKEKGSSSLTLVRILKILNASYWKYKVSTSNSEWRNVCNIKVLIQSFTRCYCRNKVKYICSWQWNYNDHKSRLLYSKCLY